MTNLNDINVNSADMNVSYNECMPFGVHVFMNAYPLECTSLWMHALWSARLYECIPLLVIIFMNAGSLVAFTDDAHL